jgi:hypothetical protein
MWQLIGAAMLLLVAALIVVLIITRLDPPRHCTPNPNHLYGPTQICR